MSGGGGGGSDSYWPGFVDALTNVVIAMIFVVVVLALSLSFAAQMMGKKIAEQIVKQHTAAAAASAAQAASSAANAVPTAEIAPVPNSALQGSIRIPVAAKAPASAPATVQVKSVPSKIELVYERTALELDPKAQQLLKEAVGRLGPDAATRRARLVATGPEPTLSDSQRAGYVRLMAVRNALLELGFPAERIDAQIDTQTATPTHSLWVSFE
jgi:hypothetical protein